MKRPLTSQQAAMLESDQYWYLGRRYSPPAMRREAMRLIRYFLQSRKQAGISASELAELLDAANTPKNVAWIQSVFASLEAEGCVLIDHRLPECQRAFWVSVDGGPCDAGPVK